MNDGTLQVLTADLAAEQDVLRALIDSLPDDAWDRDSPAEGWTLRDCVVHLAETDESATAGVQGRTLQRRGERQGVLTAGMVAARGLPPADVARWYSRAAAELIDALRGVGDGDRITWAGRPMSARSYVTARLMEHWSHGLDIHDAARVKAVDTDRLRHIALLGCITREFAYRTHGLTPPGTPLFVDLTLPSGAPWRNGPEDATDRISGTAGDFCRVVTQRIHPADTALRCEGPHAAEFLGIAQAFAGPPGSGRPPRGSASE
jgi:uncharacterized protein (TIGR03084 family)